MTCGRRFIGIAVLAATAGWHHPIAAQDVRWQRSGQAARVPVTVFHSPQSANLPTAETLNRGEWQIEVSHRFQDPLSGGIDDLWGLDGSAWIRLGLTWAAADRVNLGLLRTNQNDNLEVNTKVRFAEGGRGSVPWMAALMGGVAINPQLGEAEGIDGREPQAYGELIVNALFGGKWAVGVVPALLYNPYYAETEKTTAVSVGLNTQVYVHRGVSLLAEWNVSKAHATVPHDAGTFGIELETGGHFFKLIATNSVKTDPTQFLAGTPVRFTPREWRFGFNITRLLAY